MTVEIALDIGEPHQLRESPCQRGLDLPGILAQLGRNPREADGGIDLFLGGGRHASAARLPEDAVLGHLQLPLQGHLANADVVLLGPREVHEGGAERFGFHHAQIDLDAFAVPDRRLRRPLLEHLGDVREAGEGLHDDAGMLRGHEDVDVAHRRLAAADRPGQADALDLGQSLERMHDGAADRQGFPQRHPLLPALHELDAVKNALLRLRLDAGKAAQLAAFRQPLQLGKAGDALPVEPARRLGTDSGDAHQLDHAGRDSPLGGLDVLDATRRQILRDLARQVLAHTRDLGEAVRARQGLEILGQRLEVLGRPAVGADAEGVLALDLEDVRHQLEQTSHLEVLHGCRPSSTPLPPVDPRAPSTPISAGEARGRGATTSASRSHVEVTRP
jgi:hypothetical protein